MRDGLEEGLVKVVKYELLSEDICWVSEEDDGRKASLGVCEDEWEEVIQANPLLAKGCVEAEALFCREDGILE